MKAHPDLRPLRKINEEHVYNRFTAYECPHCGMEIRPDPSTRGGFARTASALGRLNQHLWETHPPTQIKENKNVRRKKRCL